MSKKVLYPLLALLVFAGVAFLLLVSKPEPPADDYVAPLPTVRTITAEKREEHLYVRSQGTVQPRTESQLIPEVSGRITWMSPALVAGGSFEEGDPLLRIDDFDYRNAEEKAQAFLTRADVEREYAADELERSEKLHSQNLASQSQLDDARRRFRVADANHTEARISLAQARRDLARTEIKAPYRGLVRSEQVDLGQFVGRGNAVATIYATDYVEVRLPIPSAQLAYLSVRNTGELNAEQTAPVMISGHYGNVRFLWEGELVRTEGEIDSRSRMLYGVARIRNPDGDLPPLAVGLFVEAEIQGPLVKGVIRLPRSAMRDTEQVLVVDEDNRLRFRQVKVLRIEHDEVVIRAGLEDGERVCVSPLQTVVDGMRVQAVEA
jgi:RND family efflux transporter MFP subunit